MQISAHSPGAFRLPPFCRPLGLHTISVRVSPAVALLALLSIVRSRSPSTAHPRVSAPAVHEIRSDCSDHHGADAFGAEAQVALAGRATVAVAASCSASIRSSRVTRGRVAGLTNLRSPYRATHWQHPQPPRSIKSLIQRSINGVTLSPYPQPAPLISE